MSSVIKHNPAYSMDKSREDRLQSVLDYARNVQLRLAEDSSFNSRSIPDPDLYLASLPLPYHDVSLALRKQIRSYAVQIWNSIKRINLENATDSDNQNVMAKVLALSYLLLESTTKPERSSAAVGALVQSSEPKKSELKPAPKHFRDGIKSTRACINSGNLELAYRLVEIILTRYKDVLDLDTQSQSKLQDIQDMVAEYICIRIMLEWKRGRLDLAENWSSRLLRHPETSMNFSPSMENKILDLVYEIGSDELSKNHIDSASRWLQKATLRLDISKDSQFDTDATNLRLNILHTYARVLSLGSGLSTDSQLNDVLAELKQDYGHKLAVIVLELELYQNDKGRDMDGFVIALTNMVKTVHVMESNHQLILHCVHKLCNISPFEAFDCLTTYLLQRLIPYGNDDWIQNTVILCMWILKTNAELISKLAARTTSMLTSAHRTWKRVLDGDAAKVLHIMLWKQIEKQDSDESNKLWCNLGLHHMFEQSGDAILGKFERKLVTCYLTASDYTSAMQTFQQMPADRQSQHQSQLLGYQIALKVGDQVKANKILNGILSIPNGNFRLISACVKATTEHGNKAETIRLLQRVLDRYLENPPPELNVSVLLRLITKMLISSTDQSLMTQEEALRRLCAILKTVTKFNASQSHEKRAIGKLSIEDCQWFESTAHKVAVGNLNTWPARYVVDVLEYSTLIRYPPLDVSTRSDQMSHKLRYEETVIYIQAILYMSQARECQVSWSYEDIPQTSFTYQAKPAGPDIQRLLYKNVFDRFTRLRQSYDQHFPNFTDDEEREAYGRLCTLLPLAFEALLYLALSSMTVTVESNHTAVFDEVSLLQLIKTSTILDVPSKIYAIIADVLLCNITRQDSWSPAANSLPLSSATKLLAELIEAIRESETYNVNQAARWIRCIIQITINHDESNTSGNPASAADRQNSSRFDEQAKLRLITTMTEQALQLARDSLNRANTDYDGDVLMSDRATNTNLEQSQNTDLYPQEELHYLATILFNQAIDLYVADREDDAKKWASRAIEVADCMAPSSSTSGERPLAALLRRNLVELGWEG